MILQVHSNLLTRVTVRRRGIKGEGIYITMDSGNAEFVDKVPVPHSFLCGLSICNVL